MVNRRKVGIAWLTAAQVFSNSSCSLKSEYEELINKDFRMEIVSKTSRALVHDLSPEDASGYLDRIILAESELNDVRNRLASNMSELYDNEKDGHYYCDVDLIERVKKWKQLVKNSEDNLYNIDKQVILELAHIDVGDLLTIITSCYDMDDLVEFYGSKDKVRNKILNFVRYVTRCPREFWSELNSDWVYVLSDKSSLNQKVLYDLFREYHAKEKTRNSYRCLSAFLFLGWIGFWALCWKKRRNSLKSFKKLWKFNDNWFLFKKWVEKKDSYWKTYIDYEWNQYYKYEQWMTCLWYKVSYYNDKSYVLIWNFVDGVPQENCLIFSEPWVSLSDVSIEDLLKVGTKE